MSLIGAALWSATPQSSGVFIVINGRNLANVINPEVSEDFSVAKAIADNQRMTDVFADEGYFYSRNEKKNKSNGIRPHTCQRTKNALC